MQLESSSTCGHLDYLTFVRMCWRHAPLWSIQSSWSWYVGASGTSDVTSIFHFYYDLVLMTELDDGIWITFTWHEDIIQTLLSLHWKTSQVTHLMRWNEIRLGFIFKKHAFLFCSKVAGSCFSPALSDEKKTHSHPMFLHPLKSVTCSVLSCQIGLGNGCMSKDNKEMGTSKKKPSVFIRCWSLVESQMVQSFEFLTAAWPSRSFGVWAIAVFCIVDLILTENASFVLIKETHVNTWELLYPVVMGRKMSWVFCNMVCSPVLPLASMVLCEFTALLRRAQVTFSHSEECFVGL